MKKLNRLTACPYILLILLSSALWAAETTHLSLKPNMQRGTIYNPDGLWPLMGLGVGAMDSNDSIRTGGVPMHLKLIGSYYFSSAPVVGDIGLGLHNEFLTQDGSDSDTIQSLYSEAAARYRFANRWQAGAIWSTLVDNPDRYDSNTNNLASFIGLQALKEFTWADEYLVRFGGRAMTDVGISGESINTIMAELEVSFGPGPGPVVAEELAPAVEPQPVAPHLANRAIQTYELKPSDVNFETDSTRLLKTSENYLKRLARALADNRHLFDRVEVLGHADQRGPDAYNYKLSERRARAISEKLISSGLKKSQIGVVAKGETDLVSSSMSPIALQRNRRAKLEFHGVKNQEALKNILDVVNR